MGGSDRTSSTPSALVELKNQTAICLCSPEDLIIYKLISTRPRDHEDAGSVICRQGESLDDDYVLNWLRPFEQALDDSTLVAEYQGLRREYGGISDRLLQNLHFAIDAVTQFLLRIF